MMRLNRRWLSAGSAAALCLAAAGAANGQCVGYTISNGPATFIAGTTDTGNHGDDVTAPLTFPFPVSLYGVSYASAHVASNGNLQFLATPVAGQWNNVCLPTGAFSGPTIFPLWDDQYTTDAAGGQGIFTSVSGVSPNQVFSIEWRTQNCCAGGPPVHNYCVIFYESDSFFDVVYQAVDATGTDSTVGVQAGPGGPFTQYWCNGTGVAAPASGTSLRFNCEAVAPDGTCCTAGVCTFGPQVGCAFPGQWTAGGACTPNPCPAPGAGETCGSAILVSAGSPAATGNNSTAVDDIQLPCGAGGVAYSHKDLWWVFNPGASGGTFEISACGSGIDTIIAVYDSCSNPTPIACDDDSCGGLVSKIASVNLTANTDYYIAIAAWGTAPAGGAVTLNIIALSSGACCNNATNACTITATNACTGGVYQGDNTVCDPTPCPAGACCDSATGVCTTTAGGPCPGGNSFQSGGVCTPNPCPQPLPNDDCSTAQAVTVGAPAASGNNALALNEGVTVTCGFNSGKDVWYSFNGGASGGAFQIDTNGTGFDTVLATFDGCPNSGGLQLACDDDGGDGLQSLLNVTLAANQVILIRVAGYNGQSGDYVVNITQLGFGACCNNTTGFCTETATNNCPGGTHQGDGTTCASLPCPPTNPSGFGAASPNPVPELGVATLTVTVTPGNNPPSTGLAVEANTSTVSATLTVSLLDDGVAPDATAGDNVFTGQVTTNAAAGAQSVPFTITDAQSRSGAGNINFNISAVAGACCTAGSCTISTGAVECMNGGGTYLGAGTSCGGPFYTQGSSANTFTSIAGTGTLAATISGCDDCVEDIPLPFFFNYLGTSYGNLSASSNGYLQFGATDNYLYGQAIPNAGVPNNVIAILWTDLNPGAAGDVYTLLEGVTPNQTFTISWENVSQYGAADSNSFQVVLRENGSFEFRYGTITAETFAQEFTAGFEDANGLTGVNVTGPSLGTGNLAIEFTSVTLPDPCAVAQTGACCCGSNCAITTSAACTGLNRAYAGNGTVCTPFSLSSPCCRGNFNKSAPGPGAPGGVSVQDIFDFLTGYFSTDPCANTNDSAAGPGAPNGVSVQDIFDFLSAYFGGC